MKILKNLLLGITAVLATLVVIFALGPRVDMDTTIQPLDLPTDLDQYLQQRESRFSDLKDNVEKRIVWADEPGQKTEFSIIYLHGFSATRQETAPLTDLVAAELNANSIHTRFAGHGRSNDAMLDGSVNAWLNDSVEALEIGKRLGEKVIVIGVSTGATAATWLAQNFPNDIAAQVLISPNYAPKDSRSVILTWPWGKQMAKQIIGPERSWQPINDGQDYYWTHRYPTAAILPMMGLVKLVNDGDMSAIQTPTLMIYSSNDEVISTDAAAAAFERIGSVQKQKIIYDTADDPSNHVLAGDILSPNATEDFVEMIVAFINQQ